MTRIVSNWLYDKVRHWRSETTSSEGSQIVIEADERGNRIRVDHIGREITDDRFREILRSMKERQEAYALAIAAVPPRPELRVPIFLEHTSKVVGWANIESSERGLRVAPAEIFDDATWERIQSGDLRGFSVSGIVEASECSICGRPYVDCPHVTGREYAGRGCVNHITAIRFCEVSLVQEPVNPECMLQLKKMDSA